MIETLLSVFASNAVPILFFGAVVSIIIFAGIAVYVMEKKRTEAFEAVARELGLSFSPHGTGSLENELGVFDLFQQGHSRKMKNVLSGLRDDALLVTLDYQYTTGHGKHSHTHNQTVVMVGSDTLDLPKFLLRPEGLFDKLGGLLGYQDIDFKSHPSFSAKYMLKGKEEDRIRDAFGSNVLDWFEKNFGLCVEASQDRIIVYRTDKRVKPAEISAAIEKAVEIKNLFGKA